MRLLLGALFGETVLELIIGSFLGTDMEF